MLSGPPSKEAPSSRPRLGLLTTSYPRYDTDPAGPFVRGYARALVDSGWAVDVLAPDDAAMATTSVSSQSTLPEPTVKRARGTHLRDPHIDVHRVRYMPVRSWQQTFYGAGVPDNLRTTASAWPGLATFPFALYHAARRRQSLWQAFVSHWATPCAWVAGRLRGPRPHLAVLHSADVHLLTRAPVPRTLAAHTLRAATSLQFVSEHHLRSFVGKLSAADRRAAVAKSFVLPMGVEAMRPMDEQREDTRARLGLSRCTLLALGRLVPIKGLDVLLQAVRGLNADLVIAGDGPLREALQRSAPTDQVRFTGYVTGDEKRALLHACDAFVLPSRETATGRTEGMPVALLEAIEHRMPIIASELPGLANVVHAAGGLLVEPGNVAALRAAIECTISGHIQKPSAPHGLCLSWQAQAPTLRRHLGQASL